jgi:hypothetical protein
VHAETIELRRGRHVAPHHGSSVEVLEGYAVVETPTGGLRYVRAGSVVLDAPVSWTVARQVTYRPI